jgi:hypothetical protein
MRIIKIVTILGVAIFIFAICGLFFRQAPDSSVSIKVSVLIETNMSYPVLVSVTNLSEKIVEYDMGRTVFIAFFQVGVWTTNSIDHFFREEVILAPAASDRFRNYRELPPDISGIRVGVGYVSFSWRGRLALAISRWRLLEPAAQSLFAMDERRCSNVEWSDVIKVNQKKQP